MKFIKTVRLDGQEVELQSEHLMLELNNSGRGFITVRTNEVCSGKSVEFELGEYEHYFAWFSGYVEEEQPAERGYKRLFIRETSGKFEKPLPCALRHVTLRDVCDFIQGKVGIEIITPEQSYSSTPIPLCTHAGSGYQLLNNLGRMFQIPDYIWTQSADNSVFVGSWNDCKLSQENIEVGNLESISQMSNKMTIPINAGVRPACIVNGQRVVRVTLQGTKYEIEWETDSRKSPERAKIEKEFPELAGGYHLSKYGRIVAISDPSNAGDISDPFRPKYAVDIQLLDENGNDDKETPIFPAVPLPVTSTASQGGDFAFPEIGTIVEIGFMYGRSDMPVIRNFFPTGKTIPNVGIGEMLRQQRPEVFERIDAVGNRLIETDQTISEKSYHRQIQADSENRTLGSSTASIEKDKSQSIGGNYKIQALGNIESVTAENYTVGVGGDFQQRIAGVASLISKTKAEINAPETNIKSPVVGISGTNINIGNENANILKILEDTITILADLAKEAAIHTHSGVGAPQQIAIFEGLSAKANQQKGLLTPMIA